MKKLLMVLFVASALAGGYFFERYNHYCPVEPVAEATERQISLYIFGPKTVDIAVDTITTEVNLPYEFCTTRLGDLYLLCYKPAGQHITQLDDGTPSITKLYKPEVIPTGPDNQPDTISN